MKLSLNELNLVTKGSNSQIYQYGKHEKSVILKIVPSIFKKQCRHLANEFQVLSKLEHENIIKPFKFKQNVRLQGIGSSYNQNDSQKIVSVLILQNASHRSLLEFRRKKKITIGQVRWIFAELCEAVRHLHRNYFVHRDLKLDNVMVFQNQQQILVKLGDLGFATSTKKSQTSNIFKGTKRGYMAPQIHKLLQDKQSQYDMYKSDIFALGVILFSLVMSKLPFEYSTKQNYHYKLIISGKIKQFWKMHQASKQYSYIQQNQLYEDFKQLFIRMVDPDPKKRPNIDEIFGFQWMMGRQQLILPIIHSLDSQSSL